jgi:uncharacterized membrane protein YdjX (TVP38/TMEM64 family)
LLLCDGVSTRTKAWLVLLAVVAGLIAIALSWRYTELADWASVAQVARLFGDQRHEPWVAGAVIAVFVLAGLGLFPMQLLVLATAAVFGPWLGLLYSSVGQICSALLLYGIGARFGKETLSRLLGPRWPRALATVQMRGILTVATLRIIPVIPFTFTNLAAGASGIRLADFLIGTLLGSAPGLLLLSVMGDRVIALVSDPNWWDAAILALVVLAYLGLVLMAQAFVLRLRSR